MIYMGNEDVQAGHVEQNGRRKEEANATTRLTVAGNKDAFGRDAYLTRTPRVSRKLLAQLGGVK